MRHGSVQATHGLGFAFTRVSMTIEGNPDAPRRAAAGRRRLLIVDDDPDVRQTLSLLFESRYEVFVAGDGSEALQLLGDGFAADAIVLDLMMPGVDGAAVVQELQRRNVRTPVILASAHVDVQGRARELGVADFVVKPFRFDVLQTKLARLMDGEPRPGGGPGRGGSNIIQRNLLPAWFWSLLTDTWLLPLPGPAGR